MARSTAVFAGTVLSVALPPDAPIISSADPITITFQVSTVWKGTAAQTLSVQTARDGASCGYTFQAGQEYVVYANGGAADLQVSRCSRTKLLAEAGEDLAALGTGSAPTPAVTPTPVGSPTPHQALLPVIGSGPPVETGSAQAPSSEFWLMVAAGAALALVGLRLWYKRRTPPKS
jgi:hypothetical protein